MFLYVHLNIKVCVIIMQITMFDHYANHHLFDQLCRLPSA